VKVNSTPDAANPQSIISLTLAVLDRELAKTGPAATDIAQFTAEVFLLHHLASPLNAAGGALVSSFLYSYAKAITNDRGNIQVDDVSTHIFSKPTSIMSHLSAHASVWVHLDSWTKGDATGITGKEITRRVVQKGIGDVFAEL